MVAALRTQEELDLEKKAANTGLNPSLPDTSGTLTATGEAYDKGGLGAAMGTYARGTVADAAKYAVDNPITRPIKTLAVGAFDGLRNFGKAALTGNVSPSVGTPPITAASSVPPVGIEYGPNPAPASEAPIDWGARMQESTPPVTSGAALQSPTAETGAPTGTIATRYDGQGNKTLSVQQEDGTSSSSTVPASMVTGTDRVAVNQAAGLATARPQIGGSRPGAIAPSRAADGRDYVAEATAAGIDVGKLVQEQTDRFNAPTGVNAQSMAAMRRQFENANPVYDRSPAASGPTMLGPESGIGWKSRNLMYQQQMENYRAATGNKTTLDVAGMRESGDNSRAALLAGTTRDVAGMRETGDNRRAALVAQGVAGKNAIDQQQVNQVGQQFREGAALRGTELEAKQLALGDVKQMQGLKDILSKGDPNSPEYQKAYQQWTNLNGKNENNYGVIDQYDENGQKTGATLYNKASGVIGGGRGAALQAAPMPTDTKKLVKGSVYATGRGNAVWDGTQFVMP